MLTLSNKDDIIVSLESLRNTNRLVSCNKDNILKIANFFNLQVHFVNFSKVIDIPKFFEQFKILQINRNPLNDPTNSKEYYNYQLWDFFVIATFLITLNKKISEVWYGLKKGEPYFILTEQFNNIVNGWKILHPEVKLVFPLHHKEKYEQWNMIPDKVKQYVTSCNVSQPACGECFKCKEFNNLVLNYATNK